MANCKIVQGKPRQEDNEVVISDDQRSIDKYTRWYVSVDGKLSPDKNGFATRKEAEAHLEELKRRGICS